MRWDGIRALQGTPLAPPRTPHQLAFDDPSGHHARSHFFREQWPERTPLFRVPPFSAHWRRWPKARPFRRWNDLRWARPPSRRRGQQIPHEHEWDHREMRHDHADEEPRRRASAATQGDPRAHSAHEQAEGQANQNLVPKVQGQSLRRTLAGPIGEVTHRGRSAPHARVPA